MKAKVIVGIIVVVVAIVLGAVNFLESNVEYGNFATARKAHRKIQVKGEWLKDRESSFDAKAVRFTFYMKDDNNEIVRVVYDGARPNNFEMATSVVAKGRFEGEDFHASDILTKCPSKYEGTGADVKKQS